LIPYCQLKEKQNEMKQKDFTSSLVILLQNIDPVEFLLL